jgi:hydrogenase expression/formation protein HypE
VSTDSHVVWPLFFPGGDIGRLAVCGTVNDVAMMGANPKYMTAGFILEEGFDISTLEAIIQSMQLAADEASVQIIAGDTKVVQKGKADGVYVNTTGIGFIPESVNISGNNAKPGDIVIISGTLGDHGIAVLEARGELGFSSSIQSDTAPLNRMTQSIIDLATQKGNPECIHVLRDPTRGGLATTLNEIAKQSNVNITLFENAIPVNPEVMAACEMLGFDPLYIANEGKCIIIVSPDMADEVLDEIKKDKYGKNATIIGSVQESPPKRVLMKTQLGSTRILDMLSGELLPRIC